MYNLETVLGLKCLGLKNFFKTSIWRVENIFNVSFATMNLLIALT